MARSARRPDPDEDTFNPLRAGGATLLRLIAREPVLVGGGTAFLVALSFVSANAIWYQPHAHRGRGQPQHGGDFRRGLAQVVKPPDDLAVDL